MKDFCLGFFVCFGLCLTGYTVWEYVRHVPVLIQVKEVPVLPQQLRPQPDPNILTTLERL